jgi:pimeloyl-ACP methyl ester carboxylesterase
MKEEALMFGETDSLVGIITEPPEPERNQRLPAFILLNSGSVHRVGPYRLNVKMVRNLSTLGAVSFRFDFSGIGDSLRSSFESNIWRRWVKETQDAMDVVEARRGIKRFVLVGNCSGAGISFFTACYDPRVVGAVLINLRGHKTLLRYYLKLAFTNYKSWLRIVRGSANLRDFITAASRSTEREHELKSRGAYGAENFKEDLRLMLERGTDLLIVYSEWDPGLPYFHAYLKNVTNGFKSNGNLQVEIIRGADHDFKLIEGQTRLTKIIHNWASRGVYEEAGTLSP